MIARSSGQFQVVLLAVGALMVLSMAQAAWKSARRKDVTEALEAVGLLLAGSWLVCWGLGLIPDGVFLAGLGTSFLLIMGRSFLVNRRQALSQVARSVLGGVLMATGVLGLHGLGITEGPLFYAGLSMIVFLVAVIIALLQLPRGRRR